MNLLSFNKTNPNLTVIPFKENKCTSSETQTCEEGRKKKGKKKKEEEKREKRNGLPRCEEGRKKKEKRKNLKNEERKKKRKDEDVGVARKGSVCRRLQEIFFFFGRYL